MNAKITLLAVFLTISPISAMSDTLSLTTEILYNAGVSFVAKTMGTEVAVITFGYKPPEETCKMLKNSGISVISVKNWKEDGTQSSKTC